VQPGPPILVVEDDERVLTSILPVLSKAFVPIACRTVADALKAIARLGGPPAAAVFDVGLPDGSGLEVLAALRVRYPSVPALVITAQSGAEPARRSFALDATYLPKPVRPNELRRFLVAIASRSVEQSRRFAALRIAESCMLTRRESDLLLEVAAGVPRHRLAHVLGIGENTVKLHVRHILDKTGLDSLDDVAWKIHAMATGAPEPD
jgi:DNA-binding NarL/FixJ family response regulator